MRTGRRTYFRNPTVTFRNFANAPNNTIELPRFKALHGAARIFGMFAE